MSELRKEITPFRGIVLAVSMIIGSGLLGLPGLALELGAPQEALAGWGIIAFAMIPMLYIFMRLGMRYTTAAGLARYAQDGLGPWGSYAVTYLMCGSVLLGMPALATIMASYVARLFGLSENLYPFIAVACVALMVGSNLLGVRVTSWVNTLAFGALLALLAVIVGGNLIYFKAGCFEAMELLKGERGLRFGEIWQISALLFWAYLGWENLSFGLEEFQNPQKNIPLTYWGSFGMVTLLYFLLALTSVGAEVSGLSVKGAQGMANLVRGHGGEKGLLLVMVLLLLANENAWTFSISRLFYASGKEGSLFKCLGVLDSRGIPTRSLLFLLFSFSGIILISPLLGLSVSFRILLVSQNFVFLFGIAILAFFRVEKGWRRWVCTFGGLISCLFLLSGFSWWSLYPLSLMGLGFVVYRYGRKPQL